MPLLDPNNIARWLIWFANEHGDAMTNLRLQKLLYYAQAWHLALNDEPLFDAEFQAWIHGPVIPSLYRKYKLFGSGAIPFDDTIDNERFREPELQPQVREFMMDLMNSYGSQTAWQLERLTHQEQPWIQARQGNAADVPCQNVISSDLMRSFYKKMLNGTSHPKA